ncbi:hypothetical protein BJV82DRAFT_633113 [Fennellomyces sp. T-0311]|nr:hypothetical protein BJV82DRAFT_633113 [Fennellomyces sp. T-0311]
MNESDPGSEDFPFDYRTTNDRFQEKLRQAQELEADRQILNDLERTVDFSSEDLLHLQTQHDALVHQVQEAEEQVQRLRTKLAERRKRREYEAGIMKLTPEERADAMQVEYNDDDVVDKNVLFEYLIRIGSAPLPANAADMSGSNFVRPHAELRQKAMEDPEVLKQSQFGHIHFAKADNRTEESLDGTVRYCDLEGKAYEQAFSVSFQVREAKLAIHDLTFKVSLDFEMDVGPLLEQIKTESNLLAFFRLLVHYGKLDHLRSTTFASLKTIYASRDVPVEQTSYDTLMFRSPT